MSTIEVLQISQEEEYRFPYHYVATMPNKGFSQHFVDSWGINYISSIDFVLKKMAETPPQSLIDIGCGDGRLSREIHLRFPDTKINGVDYSARAINLAKAMNTDAPCINFEQLDITNNQLGEQFDSAVLMEVFEHIPLNEAEDFIAGVRSVIKHGGMLYLTVPHSNKEVEYKHFQHFTIDRITRYLSPFFEIVEAIPFERKSHVSRVISMLLCNRVFVLNNRWLLQVIYKFHLKFLFHCASEKQCQRLFIRAIAK